MLGSAPSHGAGLNPRPERRLIADATVERIWEG